jgi:hypothetical protein
VKCGCPTASTIGFNPINLQAIRLVVLTIIAVLVGSESTSNAFWRDRVDVGDDSGVCLGHIEVEFHVTTIQIESGLCRCSTISLNTPPSIVQLHTAAICNNEITS